MGVPVSFDADEHVTPFDAAKDVAADAALLDTLKECMAIWRAIGVACEQLVNTLDLRLSHPSSV
jgi:hypothetical protein